MNRRQKALLINVILIAILTTVIVVGMVNLKDWINRSEAMLAMEQLSQEVLEYRKKHGSVPPEFFIDQIKPNLPGRARLGALKYRARWIEFGCPPDEILAYSPKNYTSSIFGKGYVVLRFDGRVEWMEKEKFEELLAKKQSLLEIQMSQ